MDYIFVAFFSFLSRPKSVHAGLSLVSLLRADKRPSLIALMRQCLMSYPLLTGHTCIAASAEDNTFPYSASCLPFLWLWPASSQEPLGVFRFMSSWLCEQFVFLILPLSMVEDWHVVSHPASPSTSTKEEPVFQQLLQTDSPANLPKGNVSESLLEQDFGWCLFYKDIC